jgi:hypothetical protein
VPADTAVFSNVDGLIFVVIYFFLKVTTCIKHARNSFCSQIIKRIRRWA